VKVWRAQWRENGRGKTRELGEYSKVSRRDARAELDRILAPLNALASSTPSPTTLRDYVESEYLMTREWKQSTRGTTEQIIEQHILQTWCPFLSGVVSPANLIDRPHSSMHLTESEDYR
jgi:hypothetical protein